MLSVCKKLGETVVPCARKKLQERKKSKMKKLNAFKMSLGLVGFK